MTTEPNKLTEEQARATGYRSLTTEYNLPTENWMLENVLSDMRRGNINFVVVEQPKGPEVWRLGIQRRES